jgi:cysteine synthase A
MLLQAIHTKMPPKLNLNLTIPSKKPTNILSTFCNTPLIQLHHISNYYFPNHTNNNNKNLWIKLEYLSPGHSKKDRVALAIIQGAKRDGLLQPKQPVVELTSGNTGTGLAIVCKALDHPFTAVMSKGNSPERYRMMKAFGAEVILVPQSSDSKPGNVTADDLKLVEEETNRVVQQRGAFRANQFHLEYNEDAHYDGTAREIWNVIQPNAFVDFGGTGGTFSGCARFFKEQNPDIQCIWIEPSLKQHKIQGGGYFTSTDGITPLYFETLAKNRGHLDGKIIVTDSEAIEGCKLLASMEGIFGGFSTGANLMGAIKFLQQQHQQQITTNYSVVFLACDSGMKYLSSNDLY